MSSIERTRPLGFLPLENQGVIRPMFRSLGIAASGLAAQRQRMETIAQNIANADVTRGPDGTPYKRQDLVLESATSQNAVFNTGSATGVSTLRGSAMLDSTTYGDGPKRVVVPVLPINGQSDGRKEFGVRVAGIAEDQGEGRLVYEPGHPDADASGYVRYPDIDTTQELVRLMDAKRMYEANAAVFQTAKSMLRASLDI